MARTYLSGERESSRSYSRAVITQGGRTVYLAGVGGTRGPGGEAISGIEEQTRAAFERLRATLAEAGGTLDDITTMTVFVTDVRYGDEVTRVRADYFTAGFPASALITVAGLARPEMLVEIVGIAVIGD
ncbi:MAG: RidA family protein [Chloroflexota bacterium]